MSLYTVKPLDDFTIFTTPASDRREHQFKATWSATLEDLAYELDSLDAGEVTIEAAVTAADVRRDGMLRSNAKVTHPGVRLSFQTRELGDMSFTCDTFTCTWGKSWRMPAWQANVRAIALSLTALRAVDRYGATQGQQYAGFAALPPGSGATAMGGMTRDEALSIIGSFGSVPVMDQTDDDLRRAYRKARAKAHPDRHAGDRTIWDHVEQAARVLGLDS